MIKRVKPQSNLVKDQIVDAYEEIKQNIDNNGDLEIDVSDCEIDILGLQILLSLQKSKEEEGTGFTIIAGDKEAALKGMMDFIGIPEFKTSVTVSA
ncbi:MAG: STAS domain-containing protein [Spirochaetales bacterium]|nr:STAS domain-containing protein [Spirochaetales bacterium]